MIKTIIALKQNEIVDFFSNKRQREEDITKMKTQ